MSSSDVEMPGSSNSDSEPDTRRQVCVAPDVAAACKRGLERVSFKRQAVYMESPRGQPARLTKHSVIWQLGDEYEKVGSGYQRKCLRCGLCTKTKMLAMNGNSTRGLRLFLILRPLIPYLGGATQS
jgi:hypothetical protein